MATVNVSTFNEFYAAVQVSGDTVVCPEGAVWDMNEIDPLNKIQRFFVKSDVVGNGTTIKNFRGDDITISVYRTIDQLHMENFYLGSDKSICTNDKEAHAYITRSKISCQLGASVVTFLANVIPTQCAITVAFQHSGENCIRWSYASGGIITGRYNRIKASCPNATILNDGRWHISDSEIIIDAPLATRIYRNNLTNCTIRGNLQSLESSAASSAASNFNVITGVSDSFPTYAESGVLVKVTDAQMRDAAYLQSIGFQIGDET
jgi:hypothetical protein